MTEQPIIGYDYSVQPFPSPAAIKGAPWNGSAVGRYLARDERGITAEEKAAMEAANVEQWLCFEGLYGAAANARLAWRGYAGGLQDARDAESVRRELGYADASPIFGTVDDQPTTNELPIIGEYFRGWASVIGRPRIGGYGSYLVIEYLFAHGLITYGWQTRGWSLDANGNELWSAHANIRQDTFGHVIDGVECDGNTILTPSNYGQASGIIAPPPVVTPPTTYAAPELPEWWARSLAQSHPSDAKVGDVTWHAIRRRVEAIAGTYRYSRPDVKSPRSGPPVATREKVAIERWFTDADNKTWLVEATGSFLFAGRFTPKITIRSR